MYQKRQYFFIGKTLKIAFARHCTHYSPEKKKEIYDKANLKCSLKEHNLAGDVSRSPNLWLAFYFN